MSDMSVKCRLNIERMLCYFIEYVSLKKSLVTNLEDFGADLSKIKTNIIVLISILLIPFFCFAQKEKLSLEQAIAMALKNNYSISIAGNNAEIARNNNTLGNAGMLPGLAINAGD